MGKVKTGASYVTSKKSLLDNVSLMKGANKNKKAMDSKEKTLRDNLDEIIKRTFGFVMENKNIGFYNTDECIDVIIDYDDWITKVSKELEMDKALLQAVLFRELRCIDVRDSVVDTLVSNHYANKYNVENRISGVTYLPEREDCSTGVGQVFAKTAIKAHNWFYNEKQAERQSNNFIESNNIDYNDWRQREEVWRLLNGDIEMNIYYAGLALKYGAEDTDKKNEGNLGYTSIKDITNYDKEEDIANAYIAILARYNGTNEPAGQYGKDVYEYYVEFSKYNEERNMD